MAVKIALNPLSSLFGGRCFLCRGGAREVLCPPCDGDLPRLSMPCCPRCALPSPHAQLCGRCLADPPAFDATHAALAYAFPADVLVHALKFQAELALAPRLGLLLAPAVAAEQVDHVVPVPLAASRLSSRGFNQAVEIARPVAGGRLELDLVRRARDTPAQTDLPPPERYRNVRGAFLVTRPLAGARVAVVDDVMTTGATLDAIAAALKAAGAARVVNWVVARTLPPQ